MDSNKPSILDPDGTLAAKVAAIRADFFTNRWEKYMEMVRWLEAHPENRDGADKTWVARATEAYRTHFRRALRVR